MTVKGKIYETQLAGSGYIAASQKMLLPLPYSVSSQTSNHSGLSKCKSDLITPLLMWIPRLGQESFAICLLGSWFACSGGSQPPHRANSQAGLWRGPCGEEPRPPTNSQHQTASHVREPPSILRWLYPSWHLSATSRRNSEPEPPGQAPPRYLTHRNNKRQ